MQAFRGIRPPDLLPGRMTSSLPVMTSNHTSRRRRRPLGWVAISALLALVRKHLRSGFHFPRNPDRYFGVPAVYSLENVKYPQRDGSVCGVRPKMGADEALKLDCGAGLGAATHVTGTFGFAMAGKAIELLLKR